MSRNVFLVLMVHQGRGGLREARRKRAEVDAQVKVSLTSFRYFLGYRD